MPSGRSIKRRIDNRAFRKLGFDTILLRSTPASGLDAYGEPLDSPWIFTPTTISIVVDTDRRAENDTELGGLPTKKEYIHFYVKGDIDVRAGDKIVYPPNTDNEWIIERLEPMVIKGTNVVTEVKASRDSRY